MSRDACYVCFFSTGGYVAFRTRHISRFMYFIFLQLSDCVRAYTNLRPDKCGFFKAFTQPRATSTILLPTHLYFFLNFFFLQLFHNDGVNYNFGYCPLLQCQMLLEGPTLFWRTHCIRMKLKILLYNAKNKMKNNNIKF